MAIEHIFGNTYGFGFTPDEACLVYDQRRYCQRIQISGSVDQAAFQFKGALTGSDLVVCGDFGSYACTLANWKSDTSGTAYAGWTWGGQMAHIVGMTTPLYQNAILTSGKLYKVTFSVIRNNPFDEIDGSMIVSLGTNQGAGITQSGDYVQYILANDTYLKITPTIGFDALIDNFTIYEVCSDYKVGLVDNTTGLLVGDTIDAVPVIDHEVYSGYFMINNPFSEFGSGEGCFTMCIWNECETGSFDDLILNGSFSSGASWGVSDGGWAISAGKATHSGVNHSILSQQVIGTKSESCYTITLDVSGYTSGTLQVKLGSTIVGTITADGSYSYSVVCDDDDADIFFTATTGGGFSIDNVTCELDPSCTDSDSCSQCLDLRNSHPCTKILKWTNDDNGFGFQYDYNSPAVPFDQGIRIDFIIKNPEYQEDQTPFTNSSGSKEILLFRGEKKKELHTEPLPEYLHDAISIAKGHDTFFTIVDDNGNGYTYVCDEGYKPEIDTGVPLLLWQVKLMIRKKTILEQNKKI